MRKITIPTLALLCSASALAQPTAFTYQGLLNSNAIPTTGLHDFRFRLFDAPTGGTQVGPTLCFDGVNVSNGAFNVRLDFGQQFVTTSPRHVEIQVRREIGQPCTDDFGYVLLTPRQAIDATPRALNANHANAAFALDAADGLPANAVVVDNAGNVGIGTSAPTAPLHVNGTGVFEKLGDQADLLWLASERSWVFRQEGTGAGAALKLESVGGGGNKNFIVQTSGFVGIGTTNPSFKLDVNGTMRAFDAQLGSVSAGISAFRGSSSTGVLVGTSQSSNGVAILGTCGSSFNTASIGVRGVSLAGDANSFGVFAAGRLGATGTKSFRIDHPDSPQTHYLFHYCAESPEVINFYRGTITLDAHGHAAVQLPTYFAKINTNPSYQLTPVGTPMPTLHVSTEISEQALAAGACTGPEALAPLCWFEIAGGTPGGKVSWRVEAARNDDFVRRFGAPVEVEKPTHEQSTQIGATP